MKRFLPLVLFLVLAFGAETTPHAFNMKVERLAPEFDELIPPGAQLEKCAEGFDWSEGPTWFKDSIVFSDVPQNVIYQWKTGQTAAGEFLRPSGMLTPRPGFREQGSNGLGTDAQGRLLICQHGERRVARVEADGTQTSLADRFEGKRFNSPNDLAVRRSGDIYFTDPPYGLDGLDKSPLKELAWNGVYRIAADGKVTLEIKDLTFPNGIALSPDEKILYVAVSDSKEPRVLAYDVQSDGSLLNARVFFDAKPLAGQGRKGNPDGLKVDAKGNVFTTGPGGVLVISPAGKHLGTLVTNEATGNCAWGEDGSTLYITADMFLVRIKTGTKGAGWR